MWWWLKGCCSKDAFAKKVCMDAKTPMENLALRARWLVQRCANSWIKVSPWHSACAPQWHTKRLPDSDPNLDNKSGF